MGKIGDDAYKFSYIIVNVLGIIGNVLVILSILRQKNNVFKNNYYFIVSHLAICDLAVLIIYLLYTAQDSLLAEPLSDRFPRISCHSKVIVDAIQLAGVGMMLVISLLRYRATVHPLKPAISRRKLKVVCGLAYLVGLIVEGGMGLPLCWIKSNAVYATYWKCFLALAVFTRYFVPTIFMAVVYYEVGRALLKQNKHMKLVRSNAMKQREPAYSFNIPRYIRNRRTFLICVGTVLCYAIAIFPRSLWYAWVIAGKNNLLKKHHWVKKFADVVRLVGSHSVNPLIYGILDKKLLTFWKGCCKKKRRSQENIVV